jgi:hypothetical protein
MSSSELANPAVAVTAALVETGALGEPRTDLTPDGPGFAEVFSGVTKLSTVATGEFAGEFATVRYRRRSHLHGD